MHQNTNLLLENGPLKPIKCRVAYFHPACLTALGGSARNFLNPKHNDWDSYKRVAGVEKFVSTEQRAVLSLLILAQNSTSVWTRKVWPAHGVCRIRDHMIYCHLSQSNIYIMCWCVRSTFFIITWGSLLWCLLAITIIIIINNNRYSLLICLLIRKKGKTIIRMVIYCYAPFYVVSLWQYSIP